MALAPRVQLPTDLTTCQADPDPNTVTDDNSLAGYILDLHSAGEDCRTKLGTVAGIVNKS